MDLEPPLSPRKQRGASLPAWLVPFLVVLTTALAWLFLGPVGGFIVLALGSLCWLVGRRETARHRALTASRRGDDIDGFIRALETHSPDPALVRMVYEEVQALASEGTEKLPLRVDDDLFRDLRLDEDDIDLDLVPSIAKRAGRSLENYQGNPFYDRSNTVGGLVLFLNAQPGIVDQTLRG